MYALTVLLNINALPKQIGLHDNFLNIKSEGRI